jgi:hypothetical protein
MFKEHIKQSLNAKTPTEYIYKLTVMRNEIQDMITEFEKECEWCVECQGYSKITDAIETVEDCRIVLRCGKCKNILRFKNQNQ